MIIFNLLFRISHIQKKKSGKKERKKTREKKEREREEKRIYIFFLYRRSHHGSLDSITLTEPHR